MTGRILHNTNNVSANNSKAATISSEYEADNEKVYSAMNDWASVASNMTTKNGMQNKVVAREEYKRRDIASKSWIIVFGNTLDVKFVPDFKDNLSRDIRFCTRLNVEYEEQQMAAFLKANPHCDKDAEEYDEQAAANDLAYDEQYGILAEARLNHELCKAEFARDANMYTKITGQPFVYQPYTIHSSKLNPATKSAAAAAARAIMARKAA